MPPTPPGSPQNKSKSKRAQGGKNRGRPKASSATESMARRASRDTVSLRAKSEGLKRRGRGTELGDETEEVDDFDELDEGYNVGVGSTPLAGAAGVSVPPGEIPRPARTGGTTIAKRGRGKIRKSIEEVPETQPQEERDVVSVSSRMSKTAKGGRKPRPVKKEKEIIPETQVDCMDLDTVQLQEEDELKPSVETATRDISNARTKPSMTSRRRAGSASDSERGDPMLRRKLNDVTRKFEEVQLRYDDLRDVGLQEAQENFDRFKGQADERARAADQLVASLRADLAAQSHSKSDTVSLRQEIESLKEDKRRTADQAASQGAEINSVKSSLQAAQNEVKALQARLAATRSGSESNGRSGPANASNLGPSKPAVSKMGGNVMNSEEAHKRRLKEELYTDLTGLIVRDVKQRADEGEDVYDCIQTGRNGTLHFHLTLPNPHPPGTSYDEAELAYEPLLDAQRDKELLEILPDYLQDEEGISFPRNQAATFYRRITECMMKKMGGSTDGDDTEGEPVEALDS